MKKIIYCIALSVSLLMLTISAFATGDGNMDGGGGGGSGSGTSQNKWSVGDDGVRISIVDANTKQVVRTPIDFSNKDRSDIRYDFGKVSKLSYKNGQRLKLKEYTYKSIIPRVKMPQIINYKGKNDIVAIKKYFTAAETIALVAERASIDYDELISGKYKLLLEPVVYITYYGNRFAMTAHEAALYNEKTGNNDLVWKFQSITHRALPLSMFLEVSDLGFPAYKGPINNPVKDKVIKEQLGLGIVKFKDAPIDETTPTEPDKPTVPDIDVDEKDYNYRTDTDVISSIEISAKDRVTPDNPISVTFDVLGRTHTVSNIVIPEGSSQLVWVKWHTPKMPQTVNIKASISGGDISSTNIKAVVSELKEITPPDPTADDLNPKFEIPYLPSRVNNTSTNWSKWSCKWKENLVWVDYGEDENGVSQGEYIDKGDWEYSKITYSADLSASMNLVPDKKNPTYIQKGEEYESKSGYGVNLKVSTNITNNGSNDDITSVQNINTTFSDFEYKTYNRLLQKTKDNGLSSEFEFKNNKYSTYNNRTHFTPVWYPNNNYYIVNAEIMDVWTPTGMLSVNLNDKIMIQGNLHQDRHIAIMK